jgi:hypothetical protein
MALAKAALTLLVKSQAVARARELSGKGNLMRTTYTNEGWARLNQAARALNLASAHGDPKMIELARDVFYFVLKRVNATCVIPVNAARSPSRREL